MTTRQALDAGLTAARACWALAGVLADTALIWITGHDPLDEVRAQAHHPDRGHMD